MAKDYAKKFYQSAIWEKQREYILKRDHHLCTEPGCYNVATEVHHITEITPDNISDPDITLNENNLRSLCHDCHTRITREMKRNDKTMDILEHIAFDADGYPVPIDDQ